MSQAIAPESIEDPCPFDNANNKEDASHDENNPRQRSQYLVTKFLFGVLALVASFYATISCRFVTESRGSRRRRQLSGRGIFTTEGDGRCVVREEFYTGSASVEAAQAFAILSLMFIAAALILILLKVRFPKRISFRLWKIYSLYGIAVFCQVVTVLLVFRGELCLNHYDKTHACKANAGAIAMFVSMALLLLSTITENCNLEGEA